MKTLQRLRKRARQLRQELTAVYYAYRDKRVGLLPKLLLAITLGYALSPIDLIPDFIPVIGYLDDLIIVPALIALSLKLIPNEIIEECRERARKEPPQLKKNLVAAGFILLVWLALLFVVVKAVVELVAGE